MLAAQERRAPERCATVGDIARLVNAMDRFATEHSGFESSTVGGIVLNEMAAARSVYEAALVPLRHKIFTFEVALKWGFFLSNIAPRILAEEERSLSDALAGAFDLLGYNAELVVIYDLAVDSCVWDYCEEDDDADVDEDDSTDVE